MPVRGEGIQRQRLSRRQTERGSKAFGDAEQSDHHPASRWGTRIAGQPLLKVETIMRPLRTGQGRRRDRWAGREALLSLHLHVLLTEQLYARPSMVATIPVMPEQRSRPNDEGMQQHAHLARLRGGSALPLTLLAQRTGAATADAGRIDHTQAPIGFSA